MATVKRMQVWTKVNRDECIKETEKPPIIRHSSSRVRMFHLLTLIHWILQTCRRENAEKQVGSSKEEKKQFKMLWGLVNPSKERSGLVYDPIEIDLYLQIKAINDINLNEEYMDASIVITIEWFDRHLLYQVNQMSLYKKKYLYFPDQH